MSLSTLLRPTTEDTTIGKNEIRKTMAIFGKMPKPSQTTRIGAIATLGMVCDITRKGVATRSMLQFMTITNASGTPITTPAANPASTDEERVEPVFPQHRRFFDDARGNVLRRGQEIIRNVEYSDNSPPCHKGCEQGERRGNQFGAPLAQPVRRMRAHANRGRAVGSDGMRRLWLHCLCS